MNTSLLLMPLCFVCAKASAWKATSLGTSKTPFKMTLLPCSFLPYLYLPRPNCLLLCGVLAPWWGPCYSADLPFYLLHRLSAVRTEMMPYVSLHPGMDGPVPIKANEVKSEKNDSILPESSGSWEVKDL